MNITGNFFLESPGPEVIEMDQALFPHPWTAEQWKELNPYQSKLFTWRHNCQLIGFALFGTSPGDDTAHLYKILLQIQSRGDGTVILFWSEVIKELRKMNFKSLYLEVESSNLRAIKFYEKCGLRTLRKNKAYYSNGTDALVMSLTL